MTKAIFLSAFPIIVAILFALYRRERKRKASLREAELLQSQIDTGPIEPKMGGTDLIQVTAAAGVKAHRIGAIGCSVFLFAGLIYGAVVDVITRYIVGGVFIIVLIIIVLSYKKGLAARQAEEEENPNE
jgi:hypothetical protein